LKKIMAVDGVKKPDSPFNHVVMAGGFLFLTSQLSADLRTNEIIGGTVGEQTKKALDNVRLLLHAAGSAMGDVVKVVVYMRDVGRFKEMNAAYREYFKEGEEPARTTVQAQSPIAGVDVEIDVVAAAPEE
jgi:2-iminobutanoate/2-iminopropanoate deaminase